MNAHSLKDMLVTGLRKQSGLEGHRHYVGMSGIGGCSRKLYQEYLDGRKPPRDQDHWFCWTGYMHEAAVVKLLGITQQPREIVAGFDQRFRGHTDFELGDTVVDIKSVNWEKFQWLMAKEEYPHNNIAQVQMYMRHGNFANAVLIYVARDVPPRDFVVPFWTIDVKPDTELMDILDDKAKRILRAIDRRQPPMCECGWCNRT